MKKQFYLIVTTIVLSTNFLFAQSVSSNASHNVTLSLNNVIELVFTSGASGVTMNFTIADHFQNGVFVNNASQIRVRSNKTYNVAVKSANINFTSTSSTIMPVSNVLWVKESNQTSYVNMSNVDQNILSNQSRGSNTFDVSYKATPGFNYNDGTYIANVIYTATQL
jgi:hypothetical protein